MNTRPFIYDSHVSFRTTQEVKDLFLKAQKADKKRFNSALIKLCKYILDNPTNDNNDTSTNVKEEKPVIVAEKVQVAEEKEVKPIIIVTTTTPIINKEPTKDELVRDIQDDDKEEKVVSLREKRNSIKSSSELPVAFQNREEYFRYLNNVVRPKYNVSIPAEKELYLAEKAEVDKILIVDENSEDEE